MIRREGQSKFVEDLEVSKRGNILKSAAVKKEKDGTEIGADTPEEAKNVLHKFDSSPDVPNDYINKHVKRIDDGENAKKVMSDFFTGLDEAKEDKEASNEKSIRTAKTLRQCGIWKKAERDVYQNADTGDFWKISEDGKKVVRMFKEVDGVAEGVK